MCDSCGLNLDFLLSRLEPVIAQFIDTYVDDRFWNMVISQIPLSTFETTDDGLDRLFFASIYQANEKIHFSLNCSTGFLGVRQDIIDNEYVVLPVIDWYIVNQN
ncbi:14153_t:CDS:2 [Gigaspora margarita]|uniref:14153_t:CDS:1 n=1 Tax=Gigaspora margarita TaxID=4874 RepID=A0ABN7W1Z8_GIGMA|nr:14153_t:CDS:2 [Gigaspora margarita]